MANKGGVITRKEVIEDDALKWGEVYSKNLEVAIGKNKEFVSGILDIAKNINTVKSATNNTELIRAKQKEVEVITKTANVWKEQIQLENQLISIKRKQQLASESTNQAVIKERVELEVMNKVLKNSILEKMGLIGAYKKLNDARTEAKNKLRDLIASETASTAEIKKAQKEFEVLDVKVRKADAAVGDFTKNVGNYPKITSMVGSLKNLVGAFGMATGIGAFVTVTQNAIKIAREFDSEMTNLAAIAGKSRKELAPLENQIRSVGKTSINGATDIAKLATELIKLGSTDEEASKLLKPIDDLTVAMKATAEDAASLVKGLLNAYGEGADQAARYTDVLAAAANKTSLDFQGLRDSLSYLAPTAKSLGLTLEETTSIIGILADNNIKAESAGRLMATSFTRLATNGMTLEQALDKINKKQKEGANDLEVLSLAGKLFGAESAKLGLILAANREKMAGLNKEFENSNGSLKKLTEEQMKSFNNQVKNVSGAWEELILTIENGNGPISSFFAGVLSNVSKWLEGMTYLIKSQKELNQELYSKEEQTAYDNTINSLNDLSKAERVLQAQYNQGYYTEKIEALKKQNTELEKQAVLLAKQANGLSGGSGKGQLEIQLKEVNEQILQNNLSLMEYSGSMRAMNDIIKTNSKTEKDAAAAAALSDEEKKKQLEAEMKRRAEYFKLLQKLLKDSFELEKFRLERTRELNQEIVDDEEKTADERVEAMYYVNQLSISLAQTEAREKLTMRALEKEGLEKLSKAEQEAYLKSSQVKIESILSGKVAVENMTDAEILIYEQYQAKREDIDRKIAKTKQGIIDSEVAKTQKLIDAELQKQDTELQNALTAENERFRILTEGQDNIEAEVEAHERRVFAIRQEYAKKGLQSQIDALQELLKDESISAKKRAETENEIAHYKRELSELTNEKFSKDNQSRLLSEEEFAARVKELSMELKDELVNLSNSIFDSRISNIDNEIQKNEDYYNKQLELAGNDQAQKDLITKEAEKKREELEKKKRKEQHKQAVFNKVMAGVDIGIKTAQAIVAALAIGPPQGVVMAALAGAIGAVQLAAVLAAPIPKYKKGRKNGPDEIAIVGDGGVHEVIERKSGKIELTPNTDTLVQLYAGDKVHSSVDEYQSAMRAANMASLVSEKNRLSDYQTAAAFDHSYDREMIQEMKLLRKEVAKQKRPVDTKVPDLNHHLWKLNQSRWD